MSEQRVTYYKNAQVASTELTIPEKLKGRYFSYLSNKKVPLFIQTPTLQVESIGDDSIRLKVKKDGQFAQLLKQLDDFVIDYISDRTVQFFRGSLFSRNKIANSYIPTLDENGRLTVQVHNPNKLLIKDQRDIVRKFNDLTPGTDLIAILNIEGVALTKKTIRLILTLHQMKIYVKDLLADWCIFHDSDSEVDDDDIDVEEAEKEANAIESAYASLCQVNEKPDTINSTHVSQDVTCEMSNKDTQKPSIPSNDDDKDLF